MAIAERVVEPMTAYLIDSPVDEEVTGWTSSQWEPSEVSPPECDFSAGGAGGAAVGAAGSLFDSMSMTVDEKFCCLARIARVNEVTMKMAATTTVSLLKKLAGPRLPNTV